MTTQKKLFIKGEDLWSFMAVAKLEEGESKGRVLKRKLKPISQSSAELHRRASTPPHQSSRLVANQVCSPQFRSKYQTESKKAAENLPLSPPSMLTDLQQKGTASSAVARCAGLGLHTWGQGSLLIQVCLSPRTGSEAMEPVTQPPESSDCPVEGRRILFFPQVHTLELGTSIFMLFSNKILTIVYFYLLLQFPS